MFEEHAIDSFTSVITGGTPSTSKDEYWNNGNIPWLNSGELQQDIITKSSNFITDLGLKNSSSKLMPKDSILIALTGTTTGKVGYLTFEACANQSVTGILPSSKHIPKYLYYYLNSIRSKVMSDAYGGAQPHISQAYVKKIKIPLPPLNTQKHITQILDDAASLRDKTKQLLKEYDALTQSIFLDMFGDPVKNEKAWKKENLKKITSKIGSGSTPTGGKEAYHEEGISLIRSLNIHDNFFKMKDLAFIDEKQANKLKNVSLEKNDVLINITGASVARSTIVPDELLPARVNQHVSILRPKFSILNSVFLLHLLISPNSKAKLLGVSSQGGATREAITKDQLENFEIILPSIALQNQFAEKITLIERQKELAKQELIEIEDLFNCLLQKAFKGELK
ncbi:restriction endonuclease subunit S [Chryseobacterium indoltheticum]|uniref:restriction endonuclease subunit S n=1 Tax=Chryseobacterium indoltheticum TaxID=254 RepID=UPI001912013D|nr:restriction endonuclease subunit S [Chryseobacterium indoltheticum]QQQ27722.1 restriction endonuclease subunit S [Chryseobacterium indoltheticum]